MTEQTPTDTTLAGDGHGVDQDLSVAAKPAPVGSDDERQSPLRTLGEWVAIVVVALVIALFFRTFLVQSFWIKSGSMEHTLEVRDRVMVNRLSYRVGEPERGQIVVFDREDPVTGRTEDLIKRVIGVEGDVVEARDGVVWVNGNQIDEPYLDASTYTEDFEAITVPDDHIWVMGDNRLRSSDSRFFGPVSRDHVVGRAFVRYWPVDRIGTP